MIRATKHLLYLAVPVLAAAAIAQNASSPAQARVTLEAVTAARPLPDGIAIEAGQATLRITAQRDDILRIRIAAGRELPEDASWAVLAGPRTHTVPVQPLADANTVGFRTARLELRVERSPLRIVVRDLAGNVISADAPGRPMEFAHGGFTVAKQMPQEEHYLGLGDKLGSFDRRDQAYTLWNTDVGPQEGTDPLYKSIPFFIATQGKQAYGIFLDNTWRTWFDFGKQARDAYQFGAEGGPLDYYLIYGPTEKHVLLGYTYLTGTPPLPPLWALGFQQSRYSYTPEPALREVAERLRKDRIPADVVYLDIDYQFRNRPFTVDAERYPGFAGMVADLRKQHFHLVTITDLHVAHLPGQNYMPYETGRAGDHFVKKADGTEFVGVVWPGPAVFPDFTRAQTREWWGGLYKEFADDGVAGYWNDMNEPSVFLVPNKTMPLDNVHRIEEPGRQTRTATHAEIHNIFGMENERATYEGLLKLKPNERPFVLTRATAAGGQRYGFTWTGDNSSTWNHLRISTQQLLNLGLSGISMVGDDIGGFNGSPSADLLTKWVEVGAFNPMFRDHTTIGSLPQEMWVHGEKHEAIRRRYIETRYRLMPYIYTLAEEASRTGLPLMRPLFLEFPGAYEKADTEFLLGRDLLVAPPEFSEMMDDYEVAYPAGDWYDFWTGEKKAHPPARPSFDETFANAAADEQKPQPEPERIHPSLETLPVYVRAGAILPMQPVVQSTEETPDGPLELRVYPGPDCTGSLYQDDGHTLDYQRGVFLRQQFSCRLEGQSLTIGFGERTGSYPAWWKSIEVVVYGWQAGAASISLTGKGGAVEAHLDEAAHALHILIPDVSAKAELTLSPAPAK
ncbi:MAG: TIM-barrel domain-containing protein [Terracidiphilus sp.]